MKFSEQWLREWVDPQVDTDTLAAQLTMAGLEVEAVEPVAGAFAGVVVGKVVAVEPHPDADKLRVCQVDVGEAEPLTIVCGAPNVHQGMLAPAALVGAVLPGGLKIKKAKLRGVPSTGMLCSAKELGLAEQSEGLMPLPAEARPGQDVRQLLGLDDVAIELSLTPNRGDCLSVAGIAREVGVINRLPVAGPSCEPVAAVNEARIELALDAPDACPRYVGRLIKGINAGAETPLWLRERLRRCGLRSLGPVVDVTNYVLLELGQPMHAFDLAKLQGGITVRRAAQGERLVLLDGQEVQLDEDTLVIADQAGAQAIAGIMGGQGSAVGETTTDVFLESAFFAPAAILGRARRYGLHTDSSHRFERGVDPTLQRRAVERATRLLLDIVGGQPGPIVEQVADVHLPQRLPIALRASRIERVLGMAIAPKQVEDILTRLGLEVRGGGEEWHVRAPAFRFDLAIEEDLIEELGRVYGYTRLPSTRPAALLAMAPRPESRVPVRRLRRLLVDRGYQEAITYSFVDPQLQRLLDPEGEPIALANPISADMSVMRTGLWPGLVQAMLHNLNRQQDRVRLFETGLRFAGAGAGLRQERRLGGVACGTVLPESWAEAPRKVDFYDVKGDVEALIAQTGCGGEFRFEAATHAALRPGQTARILRGDQEAGWLGALHPAIERTLGLKERVYVFELALETLEAASVPRFGEISKFPGIRRDLALVVDEAVTWQALRECVLRVGPDILHNLEVFDVYRGKGIDSGRKSVAVGLTLQAHSRTLTDSEVDAAIAAIMSALGEELGASLRE